MDQVTVNKLVRYDGLGDIYMGVLMSAGRIKCYFLLGNSSQ